MGMIEVMVMPLPTLGTLVLVIFGFVSILVLYPIFSTGLNPIEYWFEQLKYLKEYIVKR